MFIRSENKVFHIYFDRRGECSFGWMADNLAPLANNMHCLDQIRRRRRVRCDHIARNKQVEALRVFPCSRKKSVNDLPCCKWKVFARNEKKNPTRIASSVPKLVSLEVPIPAKIEFKEATLDPCVVAIRTIKHTITCGADRASHVRFLSKFLALSHLPKKNTNP